MCLKGIEEGVQVFKSNDIENNTWYGVWSGGGSDPTIENTTISYNTQGIYCVDHSSPTITWNDIHNNTDAGVNCTSGSNPVIHYNNIEDNTPDLSDPTLGYGVNNQYPNINIDAINNWWGHETGPYHPVLNDDGEGNRVSNNVYFEPFSDHRY